MSFDITGVPSSYRAPITALELVLGQGASNAPAGRRPAVYVAKMLATGTATAGVRYDITSESQAKSLFGAGSEAHRICRKHIAVNPGGYLAVVPYAASSGGGGLVTATISVVFGLSSGTNPTGTGQVVIDVCGDEVVVGFNTTSTPTTMGADFEAKVLALAASHAPVTAGSNSTGTVPVNARYGGASQNSVHRITVVSISAGFNVTCLVGGSTTALLASGVDGTPTELANMQAALTTLTASDDYYHATPVTTGTFVAEITTLVTNKSLPASGKRSVGLYVGTAAIATITTIANTQNNYRMRCAWMRNTSHSPDEVLATVVAAMQKEEEATARKNFKDYSLGVHLKPVRDQASWPTPAEVNEAMNDGIITLISSANGVRMAAGITNSSKTSTGTDDFRANLSHRVSIMDYVADIINRNHNLTFTDFIVVDDPRNSDGTVNLNAIDAFDPRTTCPFLFKKWFFGQLNQFFPGLLQGQPDWEASTQVRVDPANNSRIQTTASGRTVDVHLQSTFKLNETTAN